MRHELTEIVADWLADGTYGVNAMLPSVALAAGDTVPEDVAAVAHEYADDWVASDDGTVPQVPCLVVQVSEVDLEAIGVGLPDAEMAGTKGALVAVGFIGRDVLGAAGRRATDYTLRATAMSLAHLSGSAGRASGTARERRGVRFLQILRLQEVPLKKDMGRGSLAGGLMALCQVETDRP